MNEEGEREKVWCVFRTRWGMELMVGGSGEEGWVFRGGRVRCHHLPSAASPFH